MAYLFGRDELKRSECGLQVGRVGLEIVESSCNAGLKLGGLLARLAVRRDLVEGAHDCGFVGFVVKSWRRS